MSSANNKGRVSSFGTRFDSDCHSRLRVEWRAPRNGLKRGRLFRKVIQNKEIS